MKAKQEILSHWEACQQFDDSPDRFNIRGLNNAPFSYPSGWLAAQATQAAQQLAGSSGHWDIFDALQLAHLNKAENIGDIDVILRTAQTLGFDTSAFLKAMYSSTTLTNLEADHRRAQSLNIRSIPAIIVNKQHIIKQTTRYDDLDCFLESLLNA
jgi:predicted DsbA family dithiol-disulfide isomerase